MSDADHAIPEVYREAAEEVRQLARGSRLTDIRDDLLELSARFERLAIYADAAIYLGAAGYPHGAALPVERADPSSATGQPHAAAAGRPRRADREPRVRICSGNKRVRR